MPMGAWSMIARSSSACRRCAAASACARTSAPSCAGGTVTSASTTSQSWAAPAGATISSTSRPSRASAALTSRTRSGPSATRRTRSGAMTSGAAEGRDEKRGRGPAEEIALQEIAAEGQERVALARRLHALGDDLAAQLATQAHRRAHDVARRRRLIDVAHQRHVELDELRLEARQAGQPRVAFAQIVDGDAIAERAQATQPRRQIADLVEAGALRQL